MIALIYLVQHFPSFPADFVLIIKVDEQAHLHKQAKDSMALTVTVTISRDPVDHTHCMHIQ